MERAREKRSRRFTSHLFYMAVTGISSLRGGRRTPMRAWRIIRTAYIARRCRRLASPASSAISTVAGARAYVSLVGRATGTFKDPNVFGPFLIPPFIFLLRICCSADAAAVHRAWRLLIIAARRCSSPSRAAPGAHRGLRSDAGRAAPSSVSRSRRCETRIVCLSVAGSRCCHAARSPCMFRASARFSRSAQPHQSYDVGETGRFGNQIAQHPDCARPSPTA